MKQTLYMQVYDPCNPPTVGESYLVVRSKQDIPSSRWWDGEYFRDGLGRLSPENIAYCEIPTIVLTVEEP